MEPEEEQKEEEEDTSSSEEEEEEEVDDDEPDPWSMLRQKVGEDLQEPYLIVGFSSLFVRGHTR